MDVLTLILLGVILPLAAVGVELATGLCKECLFDPLPTPVHAFLILLIPVVCLLHLYGWAGAQDRGRLRLLGFLHGLALGTSLFYTVFFAPVTPLGMLLVILYGAGLLLLSPQFSLLGLWLAWRKTTRRLPAGTRPPGRVLGVLGAVVLLLGADFVVSATRIGMVLSVHASPSVQATGLEMLRRWGNRDAMLRACYVRVGTRDMLDFILNFWGQVEPEEARTVFYRVTGAPFNSLPAPPRLYRDELDWEPDFDTDQAGESVGGQVRLTLRDSEISPQVQNGVVTTQWRMTFHNDGIRASEARFQLQLPPGGVVSGVGLWVNGQLREAAMGTRARARTAYERTVATRRDPLLVTMGGPERVLVQCFPVNPGCDQSLLLRVTAPLQDGEWVATPQMTERNFRLGVAAPGLGQPGTADRRPMLGPGVRGEWQSRNASPLPSPVLVVDGSARMEPYRQELKALAPRFARVLVAGGSLDAPLVGGQDNLPTLLEALHGGAPVVWVHGPQSVLLSSPDVVRGCLDRAPAGRLFSVSVGGPNRLVEDHAYPSYREVDRRGSLTEDLTRVLAGLPGYDLQLSADPACHGPAQALLPLWAARESARLAAAGDEPGAVKLALRQRIVTPWTGAVVLETAAQEKAMGLDPADPATVPTVPEPPMVLLLLVVALALAARRPAWR